MNSDTRSSVSRFIVLPSVPDQRSKCCKSLTPLALLNDSHRSLRRSRLITYFGIESKSQVISLISKNEKIAAIKIDNFVVDNFVSKMSGTTLTIQNNLIIINLEKIEQYLYDDSDKQKVVFLVNHLGGFNINYTNKTITLYLTIESMTSYMIDFNRGTSDSRVSQTNFENAIRMLGA